MAEDRATFTKLLWNNLPWFFQQGDGWSWAEPIGRNLDRLLQEALEAMRLRFPSVCPEDALTLHGQNRRIPRAGIGEDPAAYRRRLLLWLDLWAHAGLPLGLLYALQSYVFPGYPMVRYVSRSSWWYTLDEGASRDMDPWEAATLPVEPYSDGRPRLNALGQPLRYMPTEGASPRAKFWLHRADPANWDWDSLSDPGRDVQWWEYWLIVYPTSYPQQSQVYGASTGPVLGSDTCWGLEVSQKQVDLIRTLVNMYSRAGSYCRGVVFAPSLADFDPFAAPGAPGMPDGYWGRPAKSNGAGGTTYSRRRDCRYLLTIDTQTPNP